MDYSTIFFNFNKKNTFFYKKLVFFSIYLKKKAVFDKVVKLPRQLPSFFKS